MALGRAWRRVLSRTDVARRDGYERRPSRHPGRVRLRSVAVLGAGVPKRTPRPLPWRAPMARRQGPRRLREFVAPPDQDGHQYLFPAGRNGHIPTQRGRCPVGARAGPFHRSQRGAKPGRHRTGTTLQFGSARFARRVFRRRCLRSPPAAPHSSRSGRVTATETGGI